MFNLQDRGYGLYGFAQTEKFLDDMTHVFKLIAATPMMARERRTFAYPVRIHFYKGYAIVYRIEGKIVKILRVVHGRQNLDELF